MNLTKAAGSTHKTKRIGRGQGSGMGKTATKGGKGQTARKGYNEKEVLKGSTTTSKKTTKSRFYF